MNIKTSLITIGKGANKMGEAVWQGITIHIGNAVGRT